MKWYALYLEEGGLQGDHFQSFRLLVEPGDLCNEGAFHPRASERGMRSFRVMGLKNRPRDDIPNYYEKQVHVCNDCVYVEIPCLSLSISLGTI